MEDTLERVQEDFILETSYEDLSQFVYVLYLLLQPRNEVVETNQNDVNEVTKQSVMAYWKVAPSFLRPKGMN